MQELTCVLQPGGPKFDIMKAQPLTGCNAGNNGGAQKVGSTPQASVHSTKCVVTNGRILMTCFHVAKQIYGFGYLF